MATSAMQMKEDCNNQTMSEKGTIEMLETSLEFWAKELERAYIPETIQFRRGVVYGLQLAIENIKLQNNNQ